jgi:hypothetical protein
VQARREVETAPAVLRAILSELGVAPREDKTRIVKLEVGGEGLASWASTTAWCALVCTATTRLCSFCALCGHRMHGKTRRSTAYYACQPSHNLGPGAERKYANHPVSLWVREDALLNGIFGFFRALVRPTPPRAV